MLRWARLPGCRWVGRLAIIATVLGATAACTASHKPAPEQVAAQSFLDALGRGDAAAAARQTTDVTGATATIAASLAGLGSGARASFTIDNLSARTKTAATVQYSARWTIPGAAKAWTFTGSVATAKANGTWLVSWSPAVLYPQLTSRRHLSAQRTQADRADLLDSNGQPLFAKTDVVVVGIHPANVTDLAGLAQTLAGVLPVSAADIVTNVQAAEPGEFVPVITLRADAYAQVRDRIHELPGVEFHSETRLLAPTAQFAQPLLGQVGPATKEIIDASKGRIAAGDQTGLSGLQRAYDEKLAGTAGLDVYAVSDGDGAGTGTGAGAPVKIANVVTPTAGVDVRLTLDRTVQAAADSALASVTQPAAIVALQPSTGKILAVANGPAVTGEIALSGQFPAGSTFKIATYSALFAAMPATVPETPVNCPGTTTVDGRSFENEDRFDDGTVTITRAFAYSCNTTAINLNLGLADTALATAAGQLGMGSNWNLPVPAFAGSIPPSATGTEKAAEAIGQGQVLVSPAAMASIAGAATTGRAITPTIEDDRPGTAGATAAADVTARINTLMRATVAEPLGTAHALADLPGPVVGKTGTAEFGTAVPPQSHAWMVGARGDLAFAVFVYAGERSSTTAVPIAHAFLAAVPT